MYLDADGFRFEVKRGCIEISRGSQPFMCLPVVPKVEGEELQLGSWEDAGNNHFCMRVGELGSVHLALREGHVCYWMETDRKHFDRLTYFANSQPTETGWHTFLSDELDRYWSLDENADVPLANAYMSGHPDEPDGGGMTDPGDKPLTWIWNIPPRALAFETCEGWMGLSIPGPISVGVTRLTMQRGIFNLTFEELRPCAAEWGPPRVYFVPGLQDPYDTLDRHRLISRRCGLMRDEVQDHPQWWSYPSFKCGDEVYRVNNKQWILRDEEGNYTSYLTTRNWLRWIDHVAEYSGLKGRMNLQVDQLYFHGYGSREVIATLGGTEGFRKTIDHLRERGMRVGLYIHLYMLDPTATDFPARHPEAICKPRMPGLTVRHGVRVGPQDMVYVDWTHPLGRQYMLDHVEWMLSDKPGCLNADWLLINNNRAVDPRKWSFHDPEWGIGDLLAMKSTKLTYEHAKRVKPGCYVRRQSPGDPYMQPWCDQANMCEEWNGQTTAWYRRAHIGTRVLDNVIFHADAWWVTLTKLSEYYFSLAVFCPPEIESVRHAIHPYMRWREMREKDYRRIRAGVQAYNNAPVVKSDACRVDYRVGEQPQIWRKHGRGPLAGWYAALALHKRAFVTYSEHEARIAASQERRVTIPLPPGASLKTVEAIPHEGTPRAYDYEQSRLDDVPAIRLWVPDAGGDTMYIRAQYELPQA